MKKKGYRLQPLGLIDFCGVTFGLLAGLVATALGLVRLMKKPAFEILTRARRILLLELNGIGDTVMSLSCLRAIRKALPKAYITIVAHPLNAVILKRAQVADEVIEFEPEWDVTDNGILTAAIILLTKVPAYLRLIWRLRSRRFDLAVSFYHDLRYWLLQLTSGAIYSVGQGTNFWSGSPRFIARGLLTYSCYWKDKNRHYVAYKSFLLKSLGLDFDEQDIVLPISEEDRTKARKTLSVGGVDFSKKVVAIHPGASRDIRRWSPENFARVIDWLKAQGVSAFIVEGPNDSHWVARIVNALRESVPIAKPSLDDLPAVLSVADACLCLDSGSMHIANAVGTPTVAVFGLGKPQMTGCYGKAPAKFLEPPDLSCRPCRYIKCPYGAKCVDKVRVEEVILSLKEFLEFQSQGQVK